MKRFRPALNAVIGLLFMVQGVAVASAEITPLDAGDISAEASAAAVPCHGDQTGGTDLDSCCDADCPNMAACALGHIAAASAQSVPIAAAQHPLRAATVLPPLASAPPSHLRPPISLHV